jgi:hypothetical protein
MLAYTRGELSPEEEARVRERLAGHPDLVRTMTEPFPAEGANPGDPDYLPDAELATHFASMQKRMHVAKPAERGRVLQFWRYAAAIAAGIAVVLGALLWQTSANLVQPRVVGEQQVLFPDGRRGPSSEPATLTAQGESVLLITPLIGESDYDRYRIEIVDASSDRPIWSSDALRPEDDSFAILVPRRFLKPGIYRVVVFGITGTREERLATYSLRAPA